MKTPNRKHSGRNAVNESSQPISSGNLNIPAEELRRNIQDIEKLFEDSILRVETVERVPLAKQYDGKHPAGGNANEDSDEDEDSVMLFTGATTIELRNVSELHNWNRWSNGNESDERQNCVPPPFPEDQKVEDDIEKIVQQKDSK